MVCYASLPCDMHACIMPAALSSSLDMSVERVSLDAFECQ